MKAWLDLTDWKNNGERVDSRNIKKHRHDVFRLLANVMPSKRIDIPKTIQEDVKEFIEKTQAEPIDLKNIGMKETNFYELIGIMKILFLS